MILYLSGPITGQPDYREKFGKVAEILTQMGHVVLNPAALPVGLKWSQYMRIGEAMVSAASGIVLLEGWESSSGARKELALALEMNIHIFTLPEKVGAANG
jgi:hypothetical protein